MKKNKVLPKFLLSEFLGKTVIIHTQYPKMICEVNFTKHDNSLPSVIEIWETENSLSTEKQEKLLSRMREWYLFSKSST